MKTIRERARPLVEASEGPTMDEAERVLRELICEIGSFVRDSRPALPPRAASETVVEFAGNCREHIVAFLEEEIRRRFLGPPSAEEVALAAIRNPDLTDFAVKYPRDHASFVGIVVRSLRSAGLLREGNPKPTADLPKQTYEPEVIAHKLLGLRVCVPRAWTVEQIKTFADRKVLCGTTGGWFPVEMGHRGPIPCQDREDFVHVICDC